MMLISKQRGNLGEELVAKKLKKEGYTVLTKNYRKRTGEVDLIVKNKKNLIFVEVKTRTSTKIDLAEMVRPSQQKKIISAAHCYIAENRITDLTYRFDVALVDMSKEKSVITYISNAFQASEY